MNANKEVLQHALPRSQEFAGFLSPGCREKRHLMSPIHKPLSWAGYECVLMGCSLTLPESSCLTKPDARGHRVFGRRMFHLRILLYHNLDILQQSFLLPAFGAFSTFEDW